MENLIYSNPLSGESDIKDFVLEGSAKISFPDGKMRMENAIGAEAGQKANFVLWCDRTFPDNIRITWNFRPLREPGLAILFFAIMALFTVLLTSLRFGDKKDGERTLKISIPESLDFEGLFDDLFAEYTTLSELDKVKTTNMGTLYELTYRVILKDAAKTKEFLDELRCRNGNLTISCGKAEFKEAL